MCPKSPAMHELGPLEMEIVGVFSSGEELSVSEVQARLKRSGNELAYTTVMTVLTRLHGKNVLLRRKEGRQFLYAHAKRATRIGETVLSRIKRSLFRNEKLKPILALLDDERDLSSDELHELRRAIDERIKKAEGGK